MKKVLIFGMGGFAGAYLAQELQIHGYEVHGSDLHAKMIGTVSVMAADLLDAEAVEKIVCGVNPDAIINLAAVSSVGQSWSLPQTTMQVNVVGSAEAG